MAIKTASRPTRKGRAPLEARPSKTVCLVSDCHHATAALHHQRLAPYGMRRTLAVLVAELFWGDAK